MCDLFVESPVADKCKPIQYKDFPGSVFRSDSGESSRVQFYIIYLSYKFLKS